MKEKQHGIEKSHDLAALSRLISLPAPPIGATFATREMGSSSLGPNDWSLDALLRLDPDALSKIVSGAKPLKVEETPADLPKHLPGWVKDEWKLSSPMGHVYAATAFFKGPLTQGYFVVLSKDQIYLQLQTS